MTAPSSLTYDKAVSAKVEALAGYGVPVPEMAVVLAIDESDLQAIYAAELKAGHTKANANVAENLYRKATGDGRESVTAAIFWLKARARWKETVLNEHAGVEGGPIRQITRIEHVIVDPREPEPEIGSSLRADRPFTARPAPDGY